MPISYYVGLAVFAAVFIAGMFLFWKAFSGSHAWWSRISLSVFAIFVMLCGYVAFAAHWFDP